jgi:hypothetical protein
MHMVQRRVLIKVCVMFSFVLCCLWTETYCIILFVFNLGKCTYKFMWSFGIIMTVVSGHVGRGGVHISNSLLLSDHILGKTTSRDQFFAFVHTPYRPAFHLNHSLKKSNHCQNSWTKNFGKSIVLHLKLSILCVLRTCLSPFYLRAMKTTG